MAARAVLIPVLPTGASEADPGLIEPLTRLMRVYDRAISGCEAFDGAQARAAVRLLRDALSLDSSASRGFDVLYAWCETAIEAQDYLGAARCLRSLRDAWWRAVQPFPPFDVPPDAPVC